MIVTLLQGAATAQATTSPSQCHTFGLVNVIIMCDIDVDDNGTWNCADVILTIPVKGYPSGNQMTLTYELDRLGLYLKTIHIEDLTRIVVGVIGNILVGPITREVERVVRCARVCCGSSARSSA